MSPSAGLGFEDQVRRDLKVIGFRDVGGGASLYLGGHQVDACAGWEGRLIVLECTTSNSAVRRKINELRGKAPQMQHGFRQSLAYEDYNNFAFGIVTPDGHFTDSDRELASQPRPIILTSQQNLQYYISVSRLLGKTSAAGGLLAEFGLQPNGPMATIPAMRVRLDTQRPLYGYLFWCQPHDLLRVAYVARRESGYGLHYQRMMSNQRLNSIRRFINRGEIFPNNIVVGFDEKPNFSIYNSTAPGLPDWLEIGELTFPRSYRSCWIIDGQHRLYAFGRIEPNANTQKLSVFAFDYIPQERQAKYFIDINKEQKPVAADLIWDIEGEMRDKETPGQIANAAKHLNVIPPLKGNVYIPFLGGNKRGKIGLSEICTTINDLALLSEKTKNTIQSNRNPLYAGSAEARPRRVAESLATFLAELQNIANTLGRPWLWEKVLKTPGGLTISLGIYEQMLVRLERKPNSQDLQRFADALLNSTIPLVPTENQVSSFKKGSLTSYAQRRQVMAQIVNQMRQLLQDSGFGSNIVDPSTELRNRYFSLERDLTKKVLNALNIITLEDLRQRAQPDFYQTIEATVANERRTDPGFQVHLAFNFGQLRVLVSNNSDNWNAVEPLFVGLGRFAEKQEVITGFRSVQRIRNALAHGRSARPTPLDLAFLNAFEAVAGMP